MSDAPKTIWAAECRATNSTMWWPDDAGGVGVEYTRTDHVQTLIAEAVAAEREACAELCEDYNDVIWDRETGGKVYQDPCASEIRARTPADALAAIETSDKRIR